jgi:UDP-N-acetylmuramoyl-tripeptide--D-alanyl-D-alanine ligase
MKYEFFVKAGTKSIHGASRSPVEDFPIKTDSREFVEGDAFIAIKGEKNNAFRFVGAFKTDPAIVVYEECEENQKLLADYQKQFKKTTWIGVDNSVKYIQNLAHVFTKSWLEKKGHYLIAISGSNGKTTTKEMLSFVLHTVMGEQVTWTLKNNNNHLGVPFTLFQINDETKVAVVEFGSNHPGEIKVLCDIAKPNVGITTNIGLTHMEFFNSIEDVFIEEALIYSEVMKNTNGNGLFILNNDDKLLKTLPRHQGTITVGEKDADYNYQYEKNAVILNSKNEKLKIENNHIMGDHNFFNLANAILIAKSLFPNLTEKFIAAAKNFSPTLNRSQWREYKGVKFFLDAYNANPSSMRTAILNFKQYCQNHQLGLDAAYLFIGEMKEMGQNARQYHAELAQWIAEHQFKNVVYVGAMGEVFEEALKKSVMTFPNYQEARKHLLSTLPQIKIGFIKGSRSMMLEELIEIKYH